MLGQLAPWLNINTQEWGNLAARGAQLDIERQRLAEEVQERKAADSLRRDQLQFNRQDAQTQNQQAAAALALRQAALKQGGLLGQEKIDQSGQTAAAKLAAVSGHYANEAAHWGNQDKSATDRNQTAADALAAKTAAANANPPKMSFADQEKLKHLYALLTDAQVKFNAINSQKDPDGALKAVNKINTFQKQIAEMTAPMAGSTLQAGTGTTSAPDDSAAAALVPSPNLPANPKATSQSPSGNYSAPTFQSSAAAALTPTSPGTGQRKVATDADFATALKKAGGNVKSARQWLQDNGFTIPQ